MVLVVQQGHQTCLLNLEWLRHGTQKRPGTLPVTLPVTSHVAPITWMDPRAHYKHQTLRPTHGTSLPHTEDTARKWGYLSSGVPYPAPPSLHLTSHPGKCFTLAMCPAHAMI